MVTMVVLVITHDYGSDNQNDGSEDDGCVDCCDDDVNAGNTDNVALVMKMMAMKLT